MSWREQITLDEIIIISVLCYTNTLCWIFCAISLEQQSTGRHGASLGISNTLSRIRDNQSLLCLFDTAFLAEKQHILI